MTAVSGAYAQRLLMTLFLVSFGLYLFLATVTYTPFDPGWMHISSDTQQVSNASGIAGAWIADLFFGFLGWASVLIPLFLFMEALQVWWPRSFLSRPFRYAAQFFLILCTASLLYLFWKVPADTLENASGGIVGYEIGKSLFQNLTIYGATFFLVVLWILLFTLAFAVKWHKTWTTLKATPAYLQDLFYRNVPESESAFDLTTSHTSQADDQFTELTAAESDFFKEKDKAKDKESIEPPPLFKTETEAVTAKPADLSGLPKVDQMTERLFEDMIVKEHVAEKKQSSVTVDVAETTTDEIKKPEPITLRTKDELLAAQRGQRQHKPQPIPLEEFSSVEFIRDPIKDPIKEPAKILNKQPSDDGVQEQPQAVAEKAPVETIESAQDSIALDLPRSEAWRFFSSEYKQDSQKDIDDLLKATDDVKEQSLADHLLPSSAATTASLEKNITIEEVTEPLPVVGTSTLQESVLPQPQTTIPPQDFAQVWLESSTPAYDFDEPLKDTTGRPVSRAMQVAEKRKHLSPVPELDLLDPVDHHKKLSFSPEQLARLSELLEIKLQEFNVKAKVVEAQPGPVVTRFELDLAPGVKASKVTNISRDLARSMSMASVRVVEVIPGKPYIGIEIPNNHREMVRLIELLKVPAFEDPDSMISMAMGKDISGYPVIAELGKAPHMLVAGTTGSGKSVAVNSMLLSMLLKYTPKQLRLILIDPKQLELANYNDIPHLLTPVVTDMKDAVNALNWCVNEMEYRYKLMSSLKVRKLSDYNRKIEEAMLRGEDLIDPTWKPTDSAVQERAPRLQTLPSIVIVADEFADMMMQVGKKAEDMITRLAQKSRAAGIHLLLATQRPSVDVITGLIKANIPTRVALRVNSKIDSRTILDAAGAEDLLGHGDMLFLGAGKIEPERVHGAFISDDEVNRVCDAWRERGEPDYIPEILMPYDEEGNSRSSEEQENINNSDRDVLYDQCVAYVLETRKSSASSLQRKFSVGYNRAARIIDQMEADGILSELGTNGKREILV